MMAMSHCQDHILTENIWFAWSKTSYSGDKRRCHQTGRRTNEQQGKIGLLSLWAVGRLSFATFHPNIHIPNTQYQIPKLSKTCHPKFLSSHLEAGFIS